MANFADMMDDLWMKVRVASGACAANSGLEEVRNYLEKGEQCAAVAAATGMFARSDGASAAKLHSAAEALGKVRRQLNTAQSVCLDLQAIARIHRAIKVLNGPENMKPGSLAAAQAFGDLFVGAGRFAAKLPPPANGYAMILQSSGSFFVDMQRLLNPETRPSGGAQLREVMTGFERGDY